SVCLSEGALMLPKQSLHRLTLLISLASFTFLSLWWQDCDFPMLEADPPKAQPAPAARAAKVAVYDPDPQHLWNCLYAALYVRTTPDGKAYGQDELDPLLWPSSKYLLTKPRHQEAI